MRYANATIVIVHPGMRGRYRALADQGGIVLIVY